MSNFIPGIPSQTSEKTLGSGLAESSAKNALYDFYRMSACLGHELSLRLPQFKMRLAVAESCTSGLLGAALTQISGASSWFEGGIITYSNALKHNLLGVEDKVLQTFGAVSMPTVCQMAGGVCSAAKSHMGISVSGIAGPGGGSEQKPVGTVYIGLALPKNFHAVKQKISVKTEPCLVNGMENTWLKSCRIMKHLCLQKESAAVTMGAFETRARHFVFEGGRESIRQSAVLMALYFAYEQFV